MKIVLAFFLLFAIASLVRSGIVEENGICIDEIKALEVCLRKAEGWCAIGKSVTENLFRFWLCKTVNLNRS